MHQESFSQDAATSVRTKIDIDSYMTFLHDSYDVCLLDSFLLGKVVGAVTTPKGNGHSSGMATHSFKLLTDLEECLLHDCVLEVIADVK